MRATHTTLGLVLLSLALPATAAPPDLTVPAEVTPADGLAVLEPVTTAKSVTYVPIDSAKGIPVRLLADKRTLVVPTGGLAAGKYRFAAVASLGDEHTTKTFAIVVPPAVQASAPEPKVIPPAAPVEARPRAPAPEIPTGDVSLTTCRVSRPTGNGTAHSGSGTCIATEDGRSLILTNNHIFADQPYKDAPFPPAAVPVWATVQPRGSRYAYRGQCVWADADADLALVVAEVAMPAADLADDNAPAGTRVRHWGVGSGGGTGEVVRSPSRNASSSFASTVPSVSGDSGAGLFDDAGRLVGVNCGRHGLSNRDPQRGPTVEVVHGCLIGCEGGGLLARIRERIQAKRAARGRGPGPVPVNPAYPPAAPPVPAGFMFPGASCPSGTCPRPAVQVQSVPAEERGGYTVQSPTGFIYYGVKEPALDEVILSGPPRSDRIDRAMADCQAACRAAGGAASGWAMPASYNALTTAEQRTLLARMRSR